MTDPNTDGGRLTRWAELRRRCAGTFGPFAALALVVALFAAADVAKHGEYQSFLTVDNFLTMAQQATIVATAALGMTLIVLTGGIDLSAGVAMGLATTAMAYVLRDNGNVPAALAVSIGVGMSAGLVNALIITSLRIVPFIVTLGSMSVFIGLGKRLAGSSAITPPRDAVPGWLRKFNTYDVMNPWLIENVVPNFAPAVWVFLVLAALMGVVLHRTVFGRYIFAVGSNEATARLCGINVNAVKIATYTLAGLFVGIAGIMSFARLSGSEPNAGRGKELEIIAAVVVGGVSLSGGRGGVLGVIAGALLLVVITSGASLLGFPDYVRDLAMGTIIVAAVAVDQYRVRRLAGSA